MDKPTTLWDLAPDQLTARLEGIGEPAFRAEQVLSRAYSQLAPDYEAMTELPARLRERLSSELPFAPLEVVASRRSADGSTQKDLLRLDDGNTVEAVLMEYDPSET